MPPAGPSITRGIRIVQRKQVSYIEIASPSFSSRRVVGQEILPEAARILFYELYQGFAVNAYGALSREICSIESQFLPNGCHGRAVHIRSGGNSGYCTNFPPGENNP